MDNATSSAVAAETVSWCLGRDGGCRCIIECVYEAGQCLRLTGESTSEQFHRMCRSLYACTRSRAARTNPTGAFTDVSSDEDTDAIKPRSVHAELQTQTASCSPLILVDLNT